MNLTEDLLEDPQFVEFRGLPDGRCRKNPTGEYIGKRQVTLSMTEMEESLWKRSCWVTITLLTLAGQAPHILQHEDLSKTNQGGLRVTPN